LNKRIYLYTPAKYENFRLNKKKALDKIFYQCQRDIEVVLLNKHGNFVLELSGGAYELLKIAIEEYIRENTYTIMIITAEHDNIYVKQ
jgi:hypothetical protein